MNGDNMKGQEEQIIVRRMIWVNTNLLVFILFLTINIAVWVLLKESIYQAASFLVISLITLVLWSKWRKQVRDVL